jgi:hypothetical protein
MRDTIDMAREAGFELEDQDLDEWSCFTDEIERLVALVRADQREICTNAAMAAAEEAVNFAMALEREACANVCDAADKSTHPADLADAIRARGKT